MILLNQIYILIILFFVSLFGIIFLVGRKLFLLEKGVLSDIEERPFGIPHADKIKIYTINNIKKIAHITLIITIRLYVKSVNILRNKWSDIKSAIENKYDYINHNRDQREISKFLRIIGEYKTKIREIKHRIHEEEQEL